MAIESTIFTIRAKDREEFSNIRWALDDISTDDAFIVFNFECKEIKVELYDSNNYQLRFVSGGVIILDIADVVFRIKSSFLKIKSGTLSVSNPLQTATTKKETAFVEWDICLKYLFNNDHRTSEQLEKVEKMLPFKNEEQHQKWIDLATSFKFWQDIDNLTYEIINQIKE